MTTATVAACPTCRAVVAFTLDTAASAVSIDEWIDRGLVVETHADGSDMPHPERHAPDCDWSAAPEPEGGSGLPSRLPAGADDVALHVAAYGGHGQAILTGTRYFTHAWQPTLGPLPTAVANLLAELVNTHGPISWPVDDLADALDATGPQILDALDILERFDITRHGAPDHIDIRLIVHAPPTSDSDEP